MATDMSTRTDRDVINLSLCAHNRMALVQPADLLEYKNKFK